MSEVDEFKAFFGVDRFENDPEYQKLFKKKSGGEKILENWGNWDPFTPPEIPEVPDFIPRYKIFALEDCEWRGHKLKAGEGFPCRFCKGTKEQRNQNWVLESNAFVCFHGLVEYTAIRLLDSVPLGLVGSHEKVDNDV